MSSYVVRSIEFPCNAKLICMLASHRRQSNHVTTPLLTFVRNSLVRRKDTDHVVLLKDNKFVSGSLIAVIQDEKVGYVYSRFYYQLCHIVCLRVAD